MYLGPPRTLFSMSRGETSTRSNINSTPTRGTNSARQTPNRSRHGHDPSANSPEWEGSAKTASHHTGFGYPSNGLRNLQNKINGSSTNNSHNNNNNNHNKNYHDTDSQDLLDKFEALGRERRGDIVSSYRATVEDSNDVEWLDPTDDNDTELPVASGHSIQEFEEWKAKMKADERRRAGLSDESEKKENFAEPPKAAEAVAPQANEANPGHRSVDRLFGMWDAAPQNDQNLAALGRASRFSRFFKGDSAPSSPSGAAPPGLSPQPQENIDRGSPVNHHHMFPTVNSPVRPMVQPTPPVPSGDADKQGFMRIMAMLGDNPEFQAPVSAAPPAEQPKAEPPASDDVFFMSLLNKGAVLPSSVSASAMASPAISKRSPVMQNSPIVSRGVTPAMQHSQLSMPDLSKLPMQKDQFRMDPHGFPGPPPPEWIQQQVANGQFNGGPPPGFMPPPFMGMHMPPPGMMPQFPPGQNGMPPLPPHMMPPPGGFYNGPPPPMNFSMQQQQQMHLDGNMNGQFPPGPPPGMQQLPMFDSMPSGSNRRFAGHKVN